NDDDFAASVVRSLNEIHSLAEGRNVLGTLIVSSTHHNIMSADALGNESFSLGANGERDKGFSDLIKNSNYSDAQEFLYSTDQTSIKHFTGNYRSWQKAYNVEMNSTIALGHELFHAYQIELGSFI